MEQRLLQVEELVRGNPAGLREYFVAVTRLARRRRRDSRGGDMVITWTLLTRPTLTSPGQKWVNWLGSTSLPGCSGQLRLNTTSTVTSTVTVTLSRPGHLV